MILMTGLLTTYALVPESTAKMAACGLTLVSSLALLHTITPLSRWTAPLSPFQSMRSPVLWALLMETEALAKLASACAVRSSCSLTRMMNRLLLSSLPEEVALASVRPLQLSSLVFGKKMPSTPTIGPRTWRTASSSYKR